MPSGKGRPDDDDDFFDDNAVIQQSNEREFDSEMPKGRSCRRCLCDGARNAGSAICGRVLPRRCWRKKSRDSDWDPDNSDDSDDEFYGNPGAPRIRKSYSRYKLDEFQLDAIRSHVKEELGIPDPDEEWSRWMRFQRCTGILWLRQARMVQILRAEREKPPCPAAREVMELKKFESVMAFLIVCNCITIGAEGMYKPGESKPGLLALAENLFTLTFLMEWFLRIMGGTWVWCIASKMNLFDTAIVWLGVVVLWILVPIGIDATVGRALGALRVLRLARIIRTMRIIPVFRELWVLVDGVTSCFYLLFWAFVIIFVVNFVFAVSVIELVAKTDTFANDDFVQEHFGGLFPSMFTLFQIMTFDSWAVIVRAITAKMPLALILFMLHLGVTGIVLFNLMTAVVVKNALVELPRKDEEAMAIRKAEAERKKVMQLRQTFHDIDTDGTGRISKLEFDDVLEDVSFARMMKLLDIDLEELPDVFAILDDGDGEIGLESFISGLMRMQGPAMARDMLKSSKRLTLLSTGFQKEEENLRSGCVEVLDQVEGDLDVMHEDFTKMQLLIKKNVEQLNSIGVRRIMRATRPELPAAKIPTLEDAHRMEREAAKALHQAAVAGRKGVPSKSPVGRGGQDKVEGVFMKPLPASWIVRRKQGELERKRKQALEVDESSKPKKIEEKKQGQPGVHKQFQHLWKEYGFEVPDVSMDTLEQVAFGKLATSPTAAPGSGLASPVSQPTSPLGQVGPVHVERPPPEPWPTFIQGISSLLVPPAPPHRLPPIAEMPDPPSPDSLPAMLADLDLRELPHHPHTPAD